MKPSLELCTLATNPQAPSPTAGMVKVEDGFMVAYGGLMCIRVPVPFAFGCCFDPHAVKTFFRKERPAISYAVKKNKLILQDGGEKLTVPTLPPEDMVTLDAICPTREMTLDVKLLRHLSTVIDPSNFRVSAQGVTCRDGMLIATNNRVIIAAAVDCPIRFNIHKDACAALAKFKTKVVGVATDGRLVKFIFEDGASLTTPNIIDELPDVSPFLSGDGWEPITISEEMSADLLKLDVFGFVIDEGVIRYHNEKKDVQGELRCPGMTGPQSGVATKSLGFILRNGGKLSRRDSRMIRSVNGDVCVVASLQHIS